MYIYYTCIDICIRGLGFESQTGQVTGKSTHAPALRNHLITSQQLAVRRTCKRTANQFPSLWRDRHPAVKGLRPPERHAGHLLGTEKTPPSQTL